MEAVGPKNMPYWGVDLILADRPGVPREVPSRPLPGAHDLALQPGGTKTLTRPELHRATPVFSTALPPHGPSGLIRRLAYRYSDNLVRHWLLLLLADRVDTVQGVVVSFGRQVVSIGRQVVSFGRRLVHGVASVLGMLGMVRRQLAPVPVR